MWGSCLHDCIAAQRLLEKKGISAEIIDVATIKPLDLKSILTSVRKTGRCAIVHEAVKTGGVGADISARISEHALESLLAPVKRITAPDKAVPHFKHECGFLPQINDIVTTVEQMMRYQ